MVELRPVPRRRAERASQCAECRCGQRAVDDGGAQESSNLLPTAPRDGDDAGAGDSDGNGDGDGDGIDDPLRGGAIAPSSSRAEWRGGKQRKTSVGTARRLRKKLVALATAKKREDDTE